jgi:hypothetical protein
LTFQGQFDGVDLIAIGAQYVDVNRLVFFDLDRLKSIP